MKIEEQQGFIVAIDGPVASGKGTMAKTLAHKTHGFYLNSGALFRMLALYATENAVEIDQPALLNALSSIKLDLEGDRTLLNGQDVSDKIFTAEISRLTPIIAEMPEIHKKVIKLEQEIGRRRAQQGRIVIIEGRNIGTTVFPDANLRIYMTASVEARAKRRLEQSRIRGEDVDFETVLKDTIMRDERDMSRNFAPLVRNPENEGYFKLDNTNLTEDQTLEKIVDQLKKNGLEL
jgi:cytidylate kinase